jgi:hypothetical protein
LYNLIRPQTHHILGVPFGASTISLRNTFRKANSGE